MDRIASDWDHRIIDAVSVALKGAIGRPDDVQRLLSVIAPSTGKSREVVLAEVAVAFIRWAQDLKADTRAATGADLTDANEGTVRP